MIGVQVLRLEPTRIKSFEILTDGIVVINIYKSGSGAET